MSTGYFTTRRKHGETLLIGDDVEVFVKDARHGRVTLAIKAPGRVIRTVTIEKERLQEQRVFLPGKDDQE